VTGIIRQFIRHPADVPIEYSRRETIGENKARLKNINQGGLCFNVRTRIHAGTAVRNVISICQPPFNAKGEVVWCRRINDHYDVGIKFKGASTGFAVRMVEQICHIEQYKGDVLRREGRRLFGEEAAREWIRKYASDFPG